jgi:hypothetical protein
VNHNVTIMRLIGSCVYAVNRRRSHAQGMSGTRGRTGDLSRHVRTMWDKNRLFPIRRPRLLPWPPPVCVISITKVIISPAGRELLSKQGSEAAGPREGHGVPLAGWPPPRALRDNTRRQEGRVPTREVSAHAPSRVKGRVGEWPTQALCGPSSMNRSKGSKESLMALIDLYPRENFGGVALRLAADVANLNDIFFNDVVSSVIVHEGTFTLFQNAGWTGFSLTVCKTGGPKEDGQYPTHKSLANRGDTISSLLVNSHEPKTSSPIHPHD